MTPGASPRGQELLALFGLSAAMLAFEILLLRLFELSHWHAFAGLAIGLALLGLGAAGTTLAVAGDRIQYADERWFPAALITTAAGLLGVILVHARVALQPIVASWDGIEAARLLVVDLSAFVPFYAGGLAIGRAFARWPTHARTLYALNLLGSSLGCVAASLLLVALQVETALACIALVVALVGTLVATRARLVPEIVAGALAIAGSIVMVADAPVPAGSDFKALARVRELPDAVVLETMPGLAGPLNVFRSEALRFATGLSLAWAVPIPASDLAIVGSDREIPLARAFDRPAHARASLAGLPFLLRPQGSVLVLGTSAWQSATLADPAHDVFWVEPDRRIIGLAQARGAKEPRYVLIADHPTRQLTLSPMRFALIVADQAHAGGDAADEDYLLTSEGIALALSHLAAEGLLAIPLRVTQPPRHFPRILATVADGLKRTGVAKPGAHVVAMRGLQDHLLLLAPAPFGGGDLAKMREFAERWQFDFDWLPDARGEEPSVHHRLETPVFHEVARAILARDAQLPAAATWFATGPADFDRPYVWRSLNWDRAGRMIEALGRQAMVFLDWSLVFGAATLAITTLLGFALILAPLGRLPAIVRPFTRSGVASYFALLGTGYLFIEIAVLQRGMLFVGEPVLDASIVIATFLAGSGVGSAMAPKVSTRGDALRLFGAVGAGTTLVSGVLWLATPVLLAPPLPLRIPIVVAALLPLAWAMGRPFPWALVQLAGQPRWIPWVWGINGFASVAAASLAPLISIHRGQMVTLAMGLLCYGLALVVALRWLARSTPEPAP